MICDPRFVERPYGRAFRASLPPMSVTGDLALACARLAEIGEVAVADAPQHSLAEARMGATQEGGAVGT